MRIDRILLSICLVTGLVGCVNPYSRFYKDRSGGQDVKDSSKFMLTNDVQIVEGTNPQEDYIRMMEDGYFLVGFSSFHGGGNFNKSMAVSKARSVGATTCITYDPKWADTSTGMITNYVPGKYGGFSVSTPYPIDRYNYFASYWIKRQNKFSLGLYFDNLSPDDKKKIGSNKGVKTIAVVKETPAFEADIVRGDIVKTIDGIEIIDAAAFIKLLEARDGNKIVLQIWREGVLKDIPVTLKPKS